MDYRTAAILPFLFASPAVAQFGGFSGFGGFNGNGGGNSGGSSTNGFNGGGFSQFERFFGRGITILTAHAVLACLAFVVLFPAGGILIRLGSFRGLWIAHGLFQLFAYVLYIAAAGLGIYMAKNLRMLMEPHAIIGLVLLALLFFEPIFGALHHFQFAKLGRRTGWSYAHLGIGRIAITLGIINGGLGLQLAKRTRIGAPTQTHIIVYSIVAAICWITYVLAAVVGERRRGRAKQVEARHYKNEATVHSDGISGWHGERYTNRRRRSSNHY